VAVVEGLDEGDLLVLRGRNMLSEGALVKIANEAGEENPEAGRAAEKQP